MKIIIAKTAGFCMGVRRAVDKVLDASNSADGPICTFGPLIHNPQVLSLLKSKGIPVISDIPEKGEGTVLIRAHGVPPSSKKRLRTSGFKVIDATCPRVIKVQTIIKKYTKHGYKVIILGDDDHPEVIGLNGYSGDQGYIVNSLNGIQELPDFDKAIIVAQTTFNTRLFTQIKEWATKTRPHYKIFDTICDSTEKRQAEVMELAKSVDVVVVVGGKNSGNTKRLAEIARESGKIAFHIEDETELDVDVLSKARSVAITAGASTPNWIINKVYKYIESQTLNGQNKIRQTLFKAEHFLLKTNLYLSIGAGFLCYACSMLQNSTTTFWPAIAAMLYVLSMHILNHLAAGESDKYNDPERADFYQKNKAYLALLASASGTAGLVITYFSGIFPFVILLVMSLLGLSYNLPVIPKKLFRTNYNKLKEIPGSKPVLISVAWGIVTAILPSLAKGNAFSMATIPAFFLSTGMVFARTVFFEILDMQGDRIAGQETLPITIGDKKTVLLLKQILFTLLIMMPVSAVIHLVSKLGLFLGIYPLMMLIVLYVYTKKNIMYNTKLEFIIESHLVMAGIIAIIWQIFS
jgi:4-hydroxy-3-methylbut-2-enyl diphosphate reductase